MSQRVRSFKRGSPVQEVSQMPELFLKRRVLAIDAYPSVDLQLTVRCRGRADGILESCQSIVDAMPTDTVTVSIFLSLSLLFQEHFPEPSRLTIDRIQRDFGSRTSGINLPHTISSCKSPRLHFRITMNLTSCRKS